MNTGRGMHRLLAVHTPCLTRRTFKYCARALPGRGEPASTTLSCGPLE